MGILQIGDTGAAVRMLQRQLTGKGYRCDANGIFDALTVRAVKAFQSQNLDQHGQPLVVDGAVGPLTQWSLNHRKPWIETTSAVDYTVMPKSGGTKLGRAALSAAIGEIEAGAGEVGGDNKGPFVAKYFAPARLGTGDPWCAAFLSWCFYSACNEKLDAMPFPYTVGARGVLAQLKKRGFAKGPGENYVPVPGDIVVWWRVSLAGWQGHTGLVHSVKDGMLYTIEGNRSPKVQGFSYVLSRMEKLLGFGHIP
ncbi:CHAP domain-containing protein [Luteibacter aegosomaticola]|uniref:CHAP domain-containing protein n=1 Tax=Luteibacter aegosomaticola TaxID=2911538 RepID=UPI001FF8BB0C|nr:CHAP domain-containing protein [Luteibacter aegosomaticola]UPG92170.1 CHAP domain-containing protein [Luteibacter aegosomaticola]